MQDYARKQYEEAKDEYMYALGDLWASDPFLFERANMTLHALDVFEDLEEDIRIHCLTYKGGKEILNYKTGIARYQRSMVINNKIYLKSLAEREYRNAREEEGAKLITKIIGFLAGFGQVSLGAGVCVISEGMGTAGGAVMMLQGLNNIYENGYYLAVHEEASGPLREAYHYSLSKFGMGAHTDLAYGLIDLSFSGYGLGRRIPTPREKSWSLFGIRLRQTDYVRGINSMSRPALYFEMLSDAVTVISVYPNNESDTQGQQ